ncbi:hypothetical protein Tco_0097295 [Tanacetum coccineum]
MAKLRFIMFKVDSLKVIRATLERIKLQEQGLSIQLEMQGHIHQGYYKNAIFIKNLPPIGSLNEDTVEPCYDSDILFMVPHYNTYHDSDMLNSNGQELGYIGNNVSNNESYDELTSNSNVISYTDYMLTIGNNEDN